MAFANKFGNILKQSITSNPSLYQAIRFMSSSKLFIGGLSYGTDDQSLREAFSNYGEVVEARVILDRESGRSRGFGFVSFVSTEEASAAITAMDGQELHGRMVRVNYAADRNRGGGGYGGGGGGYGGGGYGGGGSSGDNYSGGGGYGSGGGYGADGYRSGGGSGVSGGGGGNFAGDSYTDGGNAAAGFGGSGGNDNYSSKISGGGGYDNANQNEPLDDEFKDGDAEPGDYTNRQG